jgi:uncharacterized protein (TIGR02466 family)
MEKPTVVDKLFPTPVLFGHLSRDFTTEELEFIKNLTMRENLNNRVSIDTYVLNNPELLSIKEFIEEKINFYFQEIHKPTDQLSIYITQSWVNLTTPGESHHAHNHPNSFISGVFYINASNKVDAIQFHNQRSMPQIHIRPTVDHEFNSQTWSYGVETGDIVLFPSQLVHNVEQVKEHTDRTQRVSLSFNTFLKGRLGDGYNLGEIIL